MPRPKPCTSDAALADIMCYRILLIYLLKYMLVAKDSRKSREKWQKSMTHFCENRKNHGKITAAYMANNLAKN